MQTPQPFDPTAIPASREKALIHQKASRCTQIIDSRDVCPCCGVSIASEDIPLCADKIDLGFLGQGIPLYYELTTLLIWLLVLIFLVMGIHALYSNAGAQNCLNENDQIYEQLKTSDCVNNCPLIQSSDLERIKYLLNSFNCESICDHIQNICLLREAQSIAYQNKQFDQTERKVQAILVLISVVIFKIGTVLIRRQQQLTGQECDRGLISPSDFTAIITHLPVNDYDEKELKVQIEKFCEDFDPGTKQEIVKINIAYDIAQFIQDSRRKLVLEKKIEKSDKYFQRFNALPKGITEDLLSQWRLEIKDITQTLEKQSQEIENKSYRKTTSVAFVTFQTQYQLQMLLDQTQLSYFEEIWIRVKHHFEKSDPRGMYFKDHLLTIQRAPEPDDVFWENCGYSSKSKLCNRFLSWIVTIFLLSVTFGILIGLDIGQSNLLKNNNQNYIVLGFISFLISLTIALVNGVIYFCITKLGLQEKHFTKTHYDISVATKLIIIQFVNSGVLVMATNILVYNSTVHLDSAESQKFAFEKPGGISSDVFFIVIINAFLVPLTTYFDPFYLIKLIQQFRLESNHTITQMEANRLFQGPNILLYNQYAHLGKTIWITMFFAPLVPISILFAVFGLSFYYMVQKYLMLRRNCRPPYQSRDLNKAILGLIDLSPILLGIGQLWLDYAFPSDGIIKIINFVTIGLAGVELIIPAYRIAKLCLNKDKDYDDLEKYSQVNLKFVTDYDRANPITQQQAVAEFIKAINVDGTAQIDTKKALQNYAEDGGENRMTATVVRNGMLKAKVLNKFISKKPIKNSSYHEVPQQQKQTDQEISFVNNPMLNEQQQSQHQHVHQHVPTQQYQQYQQQFSQYGQNANPQQYYQQQQQQQQQQNPSPYPYLYQQPISNQYPGPQHPQQPQPQTYNQQYYPQQYHQGYPH